MKFLRKIITHSFNRARLSSSRDAMVLRLVQPARPSLIELSRRQMLGAMTGAVLAPWIIATLPSDAGWLPRAGQLGHNGGRVVMDVSKPEIWYDVAFINVLKQAVDRWSFSISGGSYTEDTSTLFNNSFYPSRMPTISAGTVSALASQVWIYGTTGTRWILDVKNAHGTVDLRLTASAAHISLVGTGLPNQGKEYNINFTSNPQPNICQLWIDTLQDGALDGDDVEIRLYPKTINGVTTSTLLDAGEVFHPDFIQRCSGWGWLRFLDWMENLGQYNNCTRWADRSQVNDYSYAPTNKYKSKYYCGASAANTKGLQVVSDPPSSFGSWQDGQIVSWKMTNRPTAVTCTNAVSNGSVTEFYSPGHGFVDGDPIAFRQSFDGSTGWQSITRSTPLGGLGNSWRKWTVTRIDNDWFSIPVNSSTYGSYPGVSAATYFVAYGQLRLQVGALAEVDCVNYHSASNIYGYNSDNMIVTGVYNAALDKILIMWSGTLVPQGMFDGVPLEHMISLANRVRANLWLCISCIKTDDFVLSAAQMVKQQLLYTLKVTPQDDNEIWNQGYAGCFLSSALAAVDPRYNSYNRFLRHGQRSKELVEIFETEFGVGSTRIEGVIDVQYVMAPAGADAVSLFQNPSVSTLTSTIFDAGTGNPSSYGAAPISTIETLASRTAVFCFNRSNTAPSPGSGWTRLNATGSNAVLEYQVFGLPQASVTPTVSGGGTIFYGFVDAIAEKVDESLVVDTANAVTVIGTNSAVSVPITTTQDNAVVLFFVEIDTSPNNLAECVFSGVVPDADWRTRIAAQGAGPGIAPYYGNYHYTVVASQVTAQNVTVTPPSGCFSFRVTAVPVYGSDTSVLGGPTPSEFPINYVDKVAANGYVEVPFAFRSDAYLYSSPAKAIVGWADCIHNHKLGGASALAAYAWMREAYSDPTTDAPHSSGDNTQVYEIASRTTSWVAELQNYTGRLGTGVHFDNYEGGNGVPSYADIDGGFGGQYTASFSGDVMTLTSSVVGSIVVGQTVVATGVSAGITIIASLGGSPAQYQLSASVGTLSSRAVNSTSVSVSGDWITVTDVQNFDADWRRSDEYAALLWHLWKESYIDLGARCPPQYLLANIGYSWGIYPLIDTDYPIVPEYPPITMLRAINALPI